MYSVLPADVAARIHGYQLDARSVPTIQTIAEMIAESEAMVDGYLGAKGVRLPLHPDGTGFTIARSVVLDLATSKAELARSRRPTEFVRETWERGKEMLDLIVSRPAVIQSGADGRAANMPQTAPLTGPCCAPRKSRARIMAERGER